MARKHKPKPNLDERFSLHPLNPEKVLRKLLKSEGKDAPAEGDDQEQSKS